MLTLIKILLVVVFVIPMVGLTAFGVIAAAAMQFEDNLKEGKYGC